MHGRYTIALCDILGFSTLVTSTDLRTVVDTLLAWFRKSLHHSIHKNGFPEDVPPLTEIDAHSKVGIAWFSDTLLLYTREDDDDCVRELLGTVGWLLFETMLQGHTRLRGGIAYGDAFIDPQNSLYVGTPIIEAHRMEQEQQWSGASLAPSGFERMPTHIRNGDSPDWWVIPYPVPLKDGLTREALAINWTTGLHRPDTFLPWSPESSEPTDADWETHRSVCEKWKNTKEFHDRICKYCSQ